MFKLDVRATLREPSLDVQNFFSVVFLRRRYRYRRRTRRRCRCRCRSRCCCRICQRRSRFRLDIADVPAVVIVAVRSDPSRDRVSQPMRTQGRRIARSANDVLESGIVVVVVVGVVIVDIVDRTGRATLRGSSAGCLETSSRRVTRVMLMTATSRGRRRRVLHDREDPGGRGMHQHHRGTRLTRRR